MFRSTVFALLVLLLTSCNVQVANQAELDTFNTNYEAVRIVYNTLNSKMVGFEDGSFDDPAFRDEIVRLSQEWRKASNDLRYMPQPAGAKWNAAWPMIVDAMGEYVFVASILEAAARDNNRLILLQSYGHLDNGRDLLTEALRLLEGE